MSARDSMVRNRIAVGLAGLSLLLATGAMLFLALWPYSYTGTEVSVDGRTVEQTSASLIEQNGADVLVALIVPALLCLVGLLMALSETPFGRIMMWAAALLLLAFSWLAILSIGAFYLPAALALLAAAAMARAARAGAPSH